VVVARLGSVGQTLGWRGLTLVMSMVMELCFKERGPAGDIVGLSDKQNGSMLLIKKNQSLCLTKIDLGLQ
jgi:hypothetical protein